MLSWLYIIVYVFLNTIFEIQISEHKTRRGYALRMAEYDPALVHVRFFLNKAALGIFSFFGFLSLQFHQSFMHIIYRRHSIVLANDSVVK